jgi:hypothetical protein
MSLVYILMEDGQHASHEESEVRDLLARRVLSPETHFWKEGMTDWRPLSELAPRGGSFVPPKRNPDYGTVSEVAVKSFQSPVGQTKPVVTPQRQGSGPIRLPSARKSERYRLRINIVPLTIFMQILFVCAIGVASWFIYQCVDKAFGSSASATADPMAVLAGSADASAGNSTGISIADRNFMIHFFFGLAGVQAVGEILFFFWIFYANKNCRGMASNMIFTSGRAVASFFIPVLNLFRPYHVVQEIWKVSLNPRGWIGRRGSIFVGFWFFIRLSTLVLLNGPFNTPYSDNDDPRIRAVGIVLYLGVCETIALLMELTTLILISIVTWRQVKWASEATARQIKKNA